MTNFEKEEFIMAFIVKRDEHFIILRRWKKKQRWETYHSYEAALHRKEQVELVQAKQREQ